MRRTYIKIFLILILIYQYFAITDFQDTINIKFLGISLFNGISLIIFLSVLVNLKKIINARNPIFNIILIYSIYQVIVIFPLSIYRYGADPYGTSTISMLIIRFSFLSIFYFYYYIIPSFKRPETILFIYKVLGIILFITGIVNYLSGRYSYTNTGEPRL